MDMHGNNQLVWWYDIPLTALLAVNVPVGMATSGVNIVNCSNCAFLTYGIIADEVCDLEVLGAADATFAVFDVLTLHAIAADTYQTPYDLGGNYGLTGNLNLTRPFIRIRLTDTSGLVHSYTRLFVRAWGV